MEYLTERDIHHDLVVIKINRTYYDGISAEALYDYTRGIWKRKIESVSVADYALSVVFGIPFGLVFNCQVTVKFEVISPFTTT